jgi:hypothetical protein
MTKTEFVIFRVLLLNGARYLTVCRVSSGAINEVVQVSSGAINEAVRHKKVHNSEHDCKH